MSSPGMRQTAVNLTDVTRSHDYGSKSRDMVKMAVTLFKMAAPYGEFKSILQGHLFFKKSFFV